jgi:hypothetical protein
MTFAKNQSIEQQHCELHFLPDCRNCRSFALFFLKFRQAFYSLLSLIF